jgi:hypothetical protein
LQACWRFFSPVSTAEGDWLGAGSPGESDRPGQSVRQYTRHKLNRLRLSPARRAIYLVPIGDVSSAPDFAVLCQCVEAMFCCQVKQGTPVLPADMRVIRVAPSSCG